MTKAILIDYTRIIKPNNLEILAGKIGVPESIWKDVCIGIILILSEQIYNILETIPKGIQKIEYLNTREFVDSIMNAIWIVYKPEKNLLEIINTIQNEDILDKVLDILFIHIPGDTFIWSGLDINSGDIISLVNMYMSRGFRSPHIVDRDPFGFNRSNQSLLGIGRKNNDNISENITLSTQETMYSLNQYKTSSICHITATFTDKTLEYLRKLVFSGNTWNKGILSTDNLSQKELTGYFDPVNLSDNILTLEINKDSIISGDEEEVQVIDSLYSFHTHPKDAYINNNTNVGWPSGSDYLGFLSAMCQYGTIFHAVVTIEGIYIISLNKSWVENICDIQFDELSKFVLSKFVFKGNDNHTISDIRGYVALINKIQFKEKKLINLQFFEWGNSGFNFSVYFGKRNKNCFILPETDEKYRKLY